MVCRACFVLSLCALFIVPSLLPATAGEPPRFRDVPGNVVEGRLRARWLAPNVRLVETTRGARTSSTITWFGPEGAAKREVIGSVGPGFVSVKGKGRTTYLGTRATWTVDVSDLPRDVESFVQAAGARGFVRERVSAEGHIQADVFVDGVRKSVLGPFLRYRVASVCTGDDGSLAVMIRGEANADLPRVAAFSPLGRATFEAECGAHASIVAISPGGAGVLIEGTGSESRARRWSWVTKAGVKPTPNLGSNAHLLAWVPNSSRALVVSTGKDPRATFRLVDFAVGTVVWKAKDPAQRAAYRPQGQVVIEAAYVLLSGIECSVTEGRGYWQRGLYALDLVTGKRVATWRSDFREAPGYEPLRFVRASGVLSLISDEEFSPFPLADLKTRKRGWH